MSGRGQTGWRWWAVVVVVVSWVGVARPGAGDRVVGGEVPVVVVQAAGEVEEGGEGGEGGGLEDAGDAVAELGGFRFTTVDQDTRDAVADVARYREKGLWEKVFRELEALRGSDLSGLVAVSDAGGGGGEGRAASDGVLYVPLRERLWLAMAELPADGREAFRLFHDAAAEELLRAMRAGETEGSGGVGEREAGERLYKDYFLTSAGPVGVDRLGDLYFERGEFAAAARVWDDLLTYQAGEALGGLGGGGGGGEGAAEGVGGVVRLRVKRAVALARAGDAAGFEAVREGLLARDGDARVTVGGREVAVREVLAGLSAVPSVSSSPGEREPGAGRDAARPWGGEGGEGAEAGVLWRCRFLTDVGQIKLMQAVQGGWSAQGTGIHRAIPPVAADAERVYANWLGVVFALDRATGKLLWTTRSFHEMANGFAEMLQRGSLLSPGRYHVDVASNTGGTPSGGVVLATSMPSEQNRWNEVYRMVAYDAATGRVKWSSSSGALEGEGFCAEPVVVPPGGGGGAGGGDDVWVVTYPQEGGRTLTLRLLDAQTGAERWSVGLGEFEPTNTRHGYEVAPAVKLAVDIGSGEGGSGGGGSGGGGTVYVLTNGGALLAVATGGGASGGVGDSGGGSVKWALKFAPPTHLGENHWGGGGMDAYTDRPGSIVRGGGTLYIKEAGGNRLLAVDAATGRVLWSHLADRDGAIAGHDAERLYLLGTDLMARDIGSGEAVWSRNLRSGAVPGSLTATGGAVVVSSEEGLLKLDASDGDVAERFDPEMIGRQGARFRLLGDLTLVATPTGIMAYGPRPDASGGSATPPGSKPPLPEESP